MHIKRLVVQRYGPLQPFDSDLSAFTVIYGPNERGKTLLIDALVRMLFKDELKRVHHKLFGNLSRVEERPEGFFVVATHAEEVKIGADDTLASVAPVPITPEDFRNVFLIRDSDLALKNEGAYYDRVSERLCGTRSGTIDHLKESLKRIGRLRSADPGSPLASRKDKEQKRINEQLAAAERLVDAIAALTDSLRVGGFDDASRRVADLAESRERLEAESHRRRDAERRSRLEAARDALRTVRERIVEAKALSAASDAGLDAWRGIVTTRSVLDRDLADLATRRTELIAAGDEAKASWDTLAARADETARRRERVDEETRPVVDAWMRDRGVRAHADRGTRAVIAAMVVSIVLGVAAVIGWVITRSLFAAGVGAVSVLSTLACGVALWRGARAHAALTRREIDLVATSARLGLPVDSADGVAEALGTLERQAGQAAERAREQETVMRQRERDVAGCEATMEERREQLRQVDRDEASLRTQSGFESIEALAAAAAARHATETEVAALIASLRSLVPSAAAAMDRDALLATCESEIERGLADVRPGDGVDVDDPEATRRVERELERVTDEERTQRQRLERSRQDLRRMEIRVSELGVIEGPIRCRTTRELTDVYARVMEFCEAVRREQRLAQEAIRIFNEIDAEEQEKVGELFGEGALVSRWFHEITDKRYRTVTLEDGEVEVEQADGKRLSASVLSGGTYDQLYLAIRASIAERMLPETRGFFILDDPFLKADRTRMRALMNMLHHLVDRGWQILYITAKDEVVDALRTDIAADRVRLIELDRSLFSPGAARIGNDLPDAPRLF
jgi:DNA repair protein SbcC/Rad50